MSEQIGKLFDENADWRHSVTTQLDNGFKGRLSYPAMSKEKFIELWQSLILNQQLIKDIEAMADNFKSDYALEENGYNKAIQDVIEYLNSKK
jgi:hypothetical protein